MLESLNGHFEKQGRTPEKNPDDILVQRSIRLSKDNAHMKPSHIAIAVVAVAAILAVVFRFETIPSNLGGYYKVDRWTGESTFVRGSVEREVRRTEPMKELVPYHGPVLPLDSSHK